MQTTNIEISETRKSINWQVARGYGAPICIRKGRRMPRMMAGKRCQSSQDPAGIRQGLRWSQHRHRGKLKYFPHFPGPRRQDESTSCCRWRRKFSACQPALAKYLH